MKSTTGILALTGLFLICFLAPVMAQNNKKGEKAKIKSGPAYVSFSLGKAPITNPARQELSLYGCNTEVTTRERFWNNEKDLEWNVNNQVMTGIPYGWQQQGEDTPYYVSKYYQASPPVFDTLNKGFDDEAVRAIIGLVIPDRFTFFGERPVQQVFLDYEILKPVYLNAVPVDYDYPNKKDGTCSEQGLNLLPLNIQCKDFRWLNNGNTYSIMDGMGASGIARTKNDSLNRAVFLASYKPNGEECLDCTVTILDDIMLNHDVSFVVDGKKSKTISLTDFYNTYIKDQLEVAKVGLSCGIRNEPPPGCKSPEN